MSEALDKLLKRQLVSQNDTLEKSTVIHELSTSHVPAMSQSSTNELSEKTYSIDERVQQTIRNSIELTKRLLQNKISDIVEKPKSNITRICPRCNIEKDREEFKTKKGNTYHGYCNLCRKEYARGYRLTGKGYKQLFKENE